MSKVKVEGLKETDDALAALGKSLGKSLLRRVAKNALVEMRDAARSMAPDDPTTTEKIADTIIISTKRPKGEKSDATRAFAQASSAGASIGDARAAAKLAGGGAVTAYMGPNRDPKNHLQEFGTVHHGPQPYMRPAWDEHARNIPPEIGEALWAEIEKTAQRKAKRDAKRAAQ